MSNKNIKYLFDDVNGEAYCTIKYKNIVFTGEAKCHPDDDDFMSDKTGCFIAEVRANIKVLKYRRNNELVPILRAFEHVQSNMDTSTKYAPKSYEAKMIHRQIKALKRQIAEVDAAIADEEAYLKKYIDDKEKLYQRLRAKS